VPPGRDLRGCPAPAPAPDRILRLTLLVLPGLWVLGVLVLSFTAGARMQLTPLLAAAPVIACASTGRRQCVVLACGCALFALVPVPGEPVGLGQRLGTALAVVCVAGASFLIAQRRIRLHRVLEELRRIAEVAQQVVLRPVPERIGPVSTAVSFLAAASGARIGGDFYEVIETPYGLRAILGDVRGNGLAAVGGAAALLGAFREAGAVEPALVTVAVRLDAALARHATAIRSAGFAGEPDLRAEDFATAVLVQIPADGPDCYSAELVVCGHPAPYVFRPGCVRLIGLDEPAPPLGMRALASGPDALASCTVPFSPGESLVLYTDGVTDARDRSGAFFPLAEVLSDILADPRGHEPEGITETLRERLVAHTRGALHDDAAVLVLRRQYTD
jgi:hypothetical protein